MLARLSICKVQESLKPKCEIVHEATYMIWYTFAATLQMDEFLLIRYSGGRS